MATDAASDAQLESRFIALWQDCSQARSEGLPDGLSKGKAAWQRLRDHYREPGRHYHDLQHVGHCLGEMDAAGERIPELRAVELAVWFHDVIYDSERADNEARSARLFADLAAPVMPAQLVSRVEALIMATTHSHALQDPVEEWMVDIDLSSFGLPWDAFRADCEDLRHESPGKTDAQFYRSKLSFLQGLLARDTIFSTAYFQQRCEAQARANIASYVDELHRRGFHSA